MKKMHLDLTIRLDNENERLMFFTRNRAENDVPLGEETPAFFVEVSLAELKDKGAEDAERLLGASVLGFFDHLTQGSLDLPKHYLDD